MLPKYMLLLGSLATARHLASSVINTTRPVIVTSPVADTTLIITDSVTVTHTDTDTITSSAVTTLTVPAPSTRIRTHTQHITRTHIVTLTTTSTKKTLSTSTVISPPSHVHGSNRTSPVTGLPDCHIIGHDPNSSPFDLILECTRDSGGVYTTNTRVGVELPGSPYTPTSPPHDDYRTFPPTSPTRRGRVSQPTWTTGGLTTYTPTYPTRRGNHTTHRPPYTPTSPARDDYTTHTTPLTDGVTLALPTWASTEDETTLTTSSRRRTKHTTTHTEKWEWSTHGRSLYHPKPSRGQVTPTAVTEPTSLTSSTPTPSVDVPIIITIHPTPDAPQTTHAVGRHSPTSFAVLGGVPPNCAYDESWPGSLEEWEGRFEDRYLCTDAAGEVTSTVMIPAFVTVWPTPSAAAAPATPTADEAVSRTSTWAA